MIYADTSFIVSAYGADVNTRAACDYLAQQQPRLPVGFLHWAELAGSLWKNYGDAEARWKIIENDLREEVQLYPLRMDAERVGRRAAGLMKGFGLRWKKIRAVDALHVAAAVEIQARVFLSFDVKSFQRVLAHTQNLKVFPALSDEERAFLK